MYYNRGNKILTLPGLLERWAEEKAHSRAFTFLNSKNEEIEQLQYESLYSNACRVASRLNQVCKTGDRVILFFEPGLEFISALMGCFMSQVIAVPIPPPRGKRQIVRTASIFQDCEPVLVLSQKKVQNRIEAEISSLAFLTKTDWLNIDAIEATNPGFEPIFPGLESPAFIQYTSGSTSTPKGVIVSHQNIIHNEEMIKQGFRHDEKTVIVGWLPFHHDMGLIGNIFQSIFLGVPCYLMAPETFLRRPRVWLEAISKYKGTTSGGPNFSYNLCLQKVTPEELTGLDLSSWKVAFNGAEMINADTLERFAKRYQPLGFQKNAFFPCYGLAEATLYVSGGHPENRLNIRPCLSENRSFSVVSCGMIRDGHRLLIVDPVSKEPCVDGEHGEIWLQGESIADGYWGKEEPVTEEFQQYTAQGEGPFFRTGDLGFVEHGELYIVGRIKTMIILRGENYFPHDIEDVVRTSHPDLENDRSTAFSVQEDGEERLILLQEIPRNRVKNLSFPDLLQAIKKNIAEVFQFQPHAVLFVKRGAVPLTTSGKVQYFQCRENYLANNFETFHQWKATEPARQKETIKAIQAADSDNQNQDTDLLAFIAAGLNMKPEEIDPDSALTDYGLDSLKGAEILHWLESNRGVTMDLADLFDAESIAQLLRKTEQEQNNKTVASSDESLTVTTHKVPLSSGQADLWIFDHLEPGNCCYNTPAFLRLQGKYDREKLIEAFRTTLSRYGILNVSFFEEQDFLYQTTNDKHPVAFHVEEAGDRWQEILQQWIDEEVYTPFDLKEGPLFRLRALIVSDKEMILSLNFHHIVCDGWSFQVMWKEMVQNYARLLDGKRVETQPTDHHYLAFAQTQQHALENGKYQHHEAYWKRKLQGELPIPELPGTRNEKKESLSQGAVVTATVTSETVQELKKLIKTEKATLAMTLMAVYKVALYHFTNQEDLIVGYPVANRRRSGHFETFGCYMNLNVSRTRLKGSGSFSDLLATIKKELLENSEFEDYPFQQMVKSLNLPRIQGVTPIFQTMFVLQDAPMQPKGLQGIECEVMETGQIAVNYDLVLEAREKGETIDLRFEYKDEKIPQAVIESFRNCFLHLLEQFIRQPSTAINALTPVAPDQACKLLEQSQNSVDYQEITFPDRFLSQVRQTPERIALMNEKESLTYRELDQKSDRLAHSLLANQLKAGDPVGVMMGRGPEIIVALLGIWKAGCLYVPMDKNYPESRLSHMVSDCRLKAVIVSSDEYPTAPFAGVSVLQFHSLCKEQTKVEPLPELEDPLSKPAYSIYTSGSTGQAKGVLVAHQSLANFVPMAQRLFGITPDDKVLQFASISWDTSMEEFLPTLASGASLIFRGDEPVESFQGLLQRTEQFGITVWNLPSSYWEELGHFLLENNRQLPPTLRLLIVGGEKVNGVMLNRWINQYGTGVRILNTYGASEATAISIACDLTEWTKERHEFHDLPIGKPVDNTTAVLLNPAGCLVPDGVPGELYLGGVGIALGYNNLPELTASRFLDDLPIEELKGRFYRTGDMAYRTESGEIVLTGRMDRQVKLRGYRIELGEIENALNEQDLVNQGFVVHETGTGSSEMAALIAYIQPKPGIDDNSQTLKKIREGLTGKLPHFMVPSRLCLISEIPRLPNGKLDISGFNRMVIYQEGEEKVEEAEEFTKTEQQILALWKRITGQEKVGKNRSFFEVGGNSLRTIKLFELLKSEFSLPISMGELFAHHTIADQAALIDRLRQKEEPQPDSNSTYKLLKQLEQGTLNLETVKERLK